jgi:hypothetical protein
VFFKTMFPPSSRIFPEKKGRTLLPVGDKSKSFGFLLSIPSSPLLEGLGEDNLLGFF